MIGKVLCWLGYHHWLHNAFGVAVPSCRRCGKPIVEQPVDPITDPDDHRILHDPFWQCELLMARDYPHLAREFSKLKHESAYKVAVWLDEKFPLKEGSWGTRLISGLYHDLKAQVGGKI